MGALSFLLTSGLYTSTPATSRVKDRRVLGELFCFLEAKSGGSSNAKNEAKADMSSFMQKMGLSNALKRSDNLVDQLQPKFHLILESPDEAVAKLELEEIKEALVPYIGSLNEEHGRSLVDAIENQLTEEPSKLSNRDKEKLRSISKVSKLGPNGQLSAQVQYLIHIGLSHDQIKDMARRFPELAYCSLDAKVKPCVDFLLQLNIPLPDVPNVLYKCPQLVGHRVQEKLLQSKEYLESLGIDKQKWPHIVHRFPALLCYHKQKIDAAVDYLKVLDISPEMIGKVLTVCPGIVGYSVESKLIPITDFFLERGFTLEEVGMMITQFPSLCGLSVEKNLKAKWEFFVYTGYDKYDLLGFPTYFGYSLRKRIKPRYARVLRSSVSITLSLLLTPTNLQFENLIPEELLTQGKDSAS